MTWDIGAFEYAAAGSTTTSSSTTTTTSSTTSSTTSTTSSTSSTASTSSTTSSTSSTASTSSTTSSTSSSASTSSTTSSTTSTSSSTTSSSSSTTSSTSSTASTSSTTSSTSSTTSSTSTTTSSSTTTGYPTCEGTGKYTADSITVDAGTTTDGVTELESIQDGLTFSIADVAATPGMDVTVDFVNVTQFDYVQILSYYDGGADHEVSIQLYCWQRSGWDTWNGMYSADEVMINHSFWVPCDSNYIGTGANDGQVRVRLVHNDLGNPAHTLYVDVVALYDRLGYLEDRLTALESANRDVVNVYDETSTQNSTGGTKGTATLGTGASGGVYPSRC